MASWASAHLRRSPPQTTIRCFLHLISCFRRARVPSKWTICQITTGQWTHRKYGALRGPEGCGASGRFARLKCVSNVAVCGVMFYLRRSKSPCRPVFCGAAALVLKQSVKSQKSIPIKDHISHSSSNNSIACRSWDVPCNFVHSAPLWCILRREIWNAAVAIHHMCRKSHGHM